MTPEQTLRAAAKHVLGPYRPIDDGRLADALAGWLNAAADRERALTQAAATTFPDDPDEQTAWITLRRDSEPLAVANALLREDRP